MKIKTIGRCIDCRFNKSNPHYIGFSNWPHFLCDKIINKFTLQKVRERTYSKKDAQNFGCWHWKEKASIKKKQIISVKLEE